jgi:hypothetical protein
MEQTQPSIPVYYVATVNYPLVQVPLQDEKAAQILAQTEVSLGNTPFQWARIDKPKRKFYSHSWDTILYRVRHDDHGGI